MQVVMIKLNYHESYKLMIEFNYHASCNDIG